MGVCLVPELLSLGYEVDAMTADDAVSTQKGLHYIKENAMDRNVISRILKNKYDAVVDFMVYNTMQFAERFEMFLQSTGHYIFLSSYRVYANEETPIRETSPRLLDVIDDVKYLETEEYGLYKARCENILRASKYNNWTIVRPAITYSKTRFQLTTLEAWTFIRRCRLGLPSIIPKEALNIQATMSWGGDAAKMIARLVCNERAKGEAFTATTSEHQTWGTIAEYYKELIGLEYIPVDTETFLKFYPFKYQLIYDRYFDRIVGNSKILEVTGLKQSDFISLKDGLKMELDALPKDYLWYDNELSKNMDEIIKNL